MADRFDVADVYLSLAPNPVEPLYLPFSVKENGRMLCPDMNLTKEPGSF